MSVNFTFPQLLDLQDFALLGLRLVVAIVFGASGCFHLKDSIGRAKSIELSPALTAGLGAAEALASLAVVTGILIQPAALVLILVSLAECSPLPPRSATLSTRGRLLAPPRVEQAARSETGPSLMEGGAMTAQSTIAPARHAPELLGQTVVVIGGSAGIGLETARRARQEGADVILTARDPDRLHRVGLELGASIAAFDATDFERLGRFFDELPAPIDHVLVTGPGPYYAPLAEFDVEKARRDVDAHLLLPLQVARDAVSKVRPGGTLLFMGGTGGRRTAAGLAFISALTAALPALTKNLALELAPIRVNLIAAGFVDTPLSAALLGDQLDARREQLRTTLPIGRVVGPADIAALAVHLMTNTAVTGATFDIDGGQQLVER